MLKRKGAKVSAKGAEIDKSKTSNTTDSVIVVEFDFEFAGEMILVRGNGTLMTLIRLISTDA